MLRHDDRDTRATSTSATTTGHPRRTSELDDDGATAWNWARNARLAPTSAVRSPASEDELRAVLAATSGPVRLLGSRMSPGRMLEPAGALPGGGTGGGAGGAGDGVLLDLTGLRGVLDVGDEHATFAGGTPLQDVYDLLTGLGRALPASPGVIASQTLGGALSTGTHGQGLGQSSIADAATSVRLVLADGAVLDVDRDHPWFGAVQLGLGTLGVISAVTLRTVPSAVWTCAKSAVSADTLEHDLVAWNTGHAMVKAWWFPDEDQVHVWAAREADPDEAARYRAGGSVLLEHAGASDALNTAVENALGTMRDDTGIVDADGKPFRTVTRFKDFTDVTGDVYQVFTRGIATPQINVEVAVPLARAGEVVQKIRAWHAETRPRMHYPVILRCTGASSAWLSPSTEQESCFFGFVVYYAADGSLSAEGEDFLREVERLLAEVGGRPHWGKYFDEGLYDWPALYPRWQAFREVREALDPGHRFDNAFTARLFA